MFNNFTERQLHDHVPDFHVQSLQNTAFEIDWCRNDSVDTDAILHTRVIDFFGCYTEIRLYFAEDKSDMN